MLPVLYGPRNGPLLVGVAVKNAYGDDGHSSRSREAGREYFKNGSAVYSAALQGLKPASFFAAFAARLKPCPFKAVSSCTDSEGPQPHGERYNAGKWH